MAATHTTNLNLNKPDREDFVRVVNDINDNMDIIDNKMGSIPSDKNLQSQITSLSDQMGKQIKQIGYTNSATVTFSVPSNSRYLFIATAANATSWGVVSLVSADTSGNIMQLEIKKGGGITSVSTSVPNRYTITYPSSFNRHYYCVPLNDAGDMTLVT